MSEVDWVPALSVLAAGLLIGAVVLWRVVLRAAPSPPAASGPPLELRDLEGKRDALIRQLRELDAEATKQAPDRIAAARDRLEHEAARVLLAIDRLGRTASKESKKRTKPVPAEAQPAAAPGAPSPAPAGSALRGFLWGVGSVAALGLLFFFVSQQAEQRAPGGTATGNTPAAGAAPADDAELSAARAAVDRQPDDIDARLDLVRLLLIRQDLMAVFNETQAVLQRSPDDPRALSYQSLVRLAMGQADQAERMLKQAMQKDPDLLDAYIHLMLVYVRTGRQAQADALLADASKRFPERAASLQDLMRQMRASASADAAAADAAPAEDPHAKVPVAGAAAGGAEPTPPLTARATAPAAGPEKTVSGMLELDPSLRGQSFGGGVVFVTLREGGFGAGPPLAAKRMPVAAFPMRFEIGSKDSMTGEPLPDDLLIEARVDSDGDPMTRSPSDPYGRADRVAAGTHDVKLVLKRRPQS